MVKTALIIGGAGTGKTTHLLDLMDKVLQRGLIDPREIGFVSFTRAARSEAATRAADRFGLNPNDLERHGWFRTLHSVAYRQLSVGDELLGPSKDTSKWLREALQEEVGGTGERNPEDDFDTQEASHPADAALNLWHLARNRLVPFSAIYERAWRCDERTPDAAFCRRIIERYEQAKRLDHRCDFTDLLGRFSGWSFQLDGHLQVTPQGPAPEIPVWFIDEAQDNSRLMDAVARRLTENAKWCYLVGDPFQAIFGWAGADPSLFQSWDSGKRRVLDKSWRCPGNILALGEACLQGASDYWDRKIAPNGPGGDVDVTHYGSPWVESLNPNDAWLLLTRTNYTARRLGQRLNANSVPWHPIKGNGGWNAPKKMKALAGLLGLPRGDAINVDDWAAILKNVPSRYNGLDLFKHGTKARWENYEGPRDIPAFIDSVSEWGATPEFVDRLKDGRWVEWIDRAYEFKTAFERWGWGGVLEPKIRIGTIHSAKGMEAENVMVLTTTSRPVWNSAQDQQGSDEEKRLSYVAVTRARKRLLIAREYGQYEMEIPA